MAWLASALGMLGGLTTAVDAVSSVFSTRDNGGEDMGWMEDAVGLLPFVGGADTGIPFLPASIDPFQRGGISLVGGKLERRRRRRRRVALTQGDRNAISFIAATVSKKAAGEFAVAISTRSR